MSRIHQLLYAYSNHEAVDIKLRLFMFAIVEYITMVICNLNKLSCISCRIYSKQGKM